MNHTALNAEIDPVDRMGQSLARMLTQSAPPLSHDITERLRIARQQAMAVRKPAPEMSPIPLAQGSSLTLPDPSTQTGGFWRGLASAVPLVALVIGLFAVQWFDGEKIVSELAEIDTALLVDDLPPAAYSDPGFMQFLRQHAVSTETQD